jgi:hypothetical protein
MSAGFWAFSFKVVRPLEYGFSELVFAALSAFFNVNALFSKGLDATRVAAVLGCIYIASRGVSNMMDEEAIEKAKKRRLNRDAAKREASASGDLRKAT